MRQAETAREEAEERAKRMPDHVRALASKVQEQLDVGDAYVITDNFFKEAIEAVKQELLDRGFYVKIGWKWKWKRNQYVPEHFMCVSVHRPCFF